MFASLRAAFAAARSRDQLRRDYQTLLGAEDRILRDIGVNRGDVRCALRDTTRRG